MAETSTGKPVKIYLYKNLFQEIRLNKGENKIIFYYSPPNINLGMDYIGGGLNCFSLFSYVYFFCKKVKIIQEVFVIAIEIKINKSLIHR